MGNFNSCLRSTNPEASPAETQLNSFIVKRQHASTTTVAERLALILETLRKNTDLTSREVPGLQCLLADYLAPGIENDNVCFTKRFLKVFRDSDTDQTYHHLLNQLNDTERQCLEKFMTGSGAEAAANGFHRDPLSLSHRAGLARLAAGPRAPIASTDGKLEEPYAQSEESKGEVEIEKVRAVVWRPLKLPIIEAVPPPPDMPDESIPLALRPKQPRGEEEKRRAQREFERHADDDDHAEWIWFPYDDQVWVSCWENAADSSDVQQQRLSSVKAFLLFVADFTLEVMQSSPLLDRLADESGIAEAVATLLSWYAMLNLPSLEVDDAPIISPVPDVLHSHRALQNARARNLEVSIPLQPRVDQQDKSDYTVSQRAWWDAILKAYEHSDKCPQRLPLRMRIAGSTNMSKAPQGGNESGTCSIGISTTQKAVGLWEPYAQDVLEKWTSYKGPDGERFRVRPVKGQEWYGDEIDGKLWVDRLEEEDYREEFKQIKRMLERIGVGHGWALQDLQARVSSELFDELTFDEQEVAEKEKELVTDYVLW